MYSKNTDIIKFLTKNHLFINTNISNILIEYIENSVDFEIIWNIIKKKLVTSREIISNFNNLNECKNYNLLDMYYNNYYSNELLLNIDEVFVIVCYAIHIQDFNEINDYMSPMGILFNYHYNGFNLVNCFHYFDEDAMLEIYEKIINSFEYYNRSLTDDDYTYVCFNKYYYNTDSILLRHLSDDDIKKYNSNFLLPCFQNFPNDLAKETAKCIFDNKYSFIIVDMYPIDTDISKKNEEFTMKTFKNVWKLYKSIAIQKTKNIYENEILPLFENDTDIDWNNHKLWDINDIEFLKYYHKKLNTTHVTNHPNYPELVKLYNSNISMTTSI